MDDFIEDVTEAPAPKRAKLTETKRFSHSRPASPPPGSDREITSINGGVVKAVRYGDSLIHYETPSVVLDGVDSIPENMDVSIEQDLSLGSLASPRVPVSPNATATGRVSSVAFSPGRSSPLRVESNGSSSRHSDPPAEATQARSSQSNGNLPQDDLLDAFIPLDAPPKRPRSNSKTALPAAAAKSSAPPSERHLGVVTNNNDTQVKLPPWAAAPYQKGHWWCVLVS